MSATLAAQVHVDKEKLCGVNQCRIVHFMFHDRVSFGGSLIAIGFLYKGQREIAEGKGPAALPALWAFQLFFNLPNLPLKFQVPKFEFQTAFIWNLKFGIQNLNFLIREPAIEQCLPSLDRASTSLPHSALRLRFWRRLFGFWNGQHPSLQEESERNANDANQPENHRAVLVHAMGEIHPKQAGDGRQRKE